MPTATRRAWIEAWEADLTPSPAAARSAARAEARIRHTRYYTREATARVPEPVPVPAPDHENGLQTTRPLRELPTTRPLPDLHVAVRRRPRWGALAFALVFVALLVGASIIGPVLVSSAATGLETQLGRLQTQQSDLAASNAALSAQISALSAPERVADQAALLGLGPAQSVRYMEAGTETAVTEGDTTVAGR